MKRMKAVATLGKHVKTVEIIGKIVEIYRTKMIIFFSFVYIRILVITKETWQNNGIEVIELNGINWLNEKPIEEGLDHCALRNITKTPPFKT